MSQARDSTHRWEQLETDTIYCKHGGILRMGGGGHTRAHVNGIYSHKERGWGRAGDRGGGSTYLAFVRLWVLSLASQ